MIETIRNGVFETNSSSCHSLTHISKEELLDWSHNQYDKCIHIPDCETYSCDPKDWGHTYEILTYKEAVDKYNKVVDFYYEQYNSALKDYTEGKSDWKPHDWDYEKYEDEYDFGKAVEGSQLPKDDIFGIYLTFSQFMAHAIIENDMSFDVQWWNNC